MSVMKHLPDAKLSKAELVELAKFATEELAKLDAENARLKAIKDNYRLEPFEYEWKVNHFVFYQKVCESVAAGIPVDTQVLESIREKSSEAKPLDYSKIYRCPECGELNALRVGSFGDSTDGYRYAVTCECCSFDLADDTASSEWYAWEIFHDWLIKNGYLDKSIRQPAQHRVKWQQWET